MQETPFPYLSRRKLLALNIGAGAFIAGSGGVWYLSSQCVAAPSVLVPPVPVPAAGTTLFIYTGHTGPVFSVAWSPNSKHIASASYDNTVGVWQAV